MPFRLAPPVAIGLALAGIIDVFLLTALVVSITSEPGRVDKVDWNPPQSAPGQKIGATKPIEGYREILARPLFSKSREPFVARPVVAAAPPPPKPPPPPPADPGISVAGIMINGVTREAYLVKKPSPQGSWVQEGAEFMGWKVQSIDAGIAALQQGDRTIELKLYADR